MDRDSILGLGLGMFSRMDSRDPVFSNRIKNIGLKNIGLRPPLKIFSEFDRTPPDFGRSWLWSSPWDVQLDGLLGFSIFRSDPKILGFNRCRNFFPAELRPISVGVSCGVYLGMFSWMDGQDSVFSDRIRRYWAPTAAGIFFRPISVRVKQSIGSRL